MMPRGAAVLVLVSVTLAAAATGAQTPGFRYERPVLADTPGPNRLAADAPLVLGAAKDLKRQPGERVVDFRTNSRHGFSDLRLYDASGRDVPYLLLWPDYETPQWLNTTLLPVAAAEKSSGFEADLGTLHPVDMLNITGLPAPFLKRLVLEGSGDRQRWTMLVPEGTLFDLPAEKLQAHQLGFRAGPYRFLRVTWDDTNSGRVPLPRAVYARRAPAGRTNPPDVVIEAPFERRPSEPGRSRYRIRVPSVGGLVHGFDLHIGGGHVFREAVVSEAHFEGGQLVPREIGRATLSRIVRDGLSAESLRIYTWPPGEQAVDLVIEDGNNPPLDLQRITVVLSRYPWIYFESPGGPITARYGDPTVSAPRYDLEAVRDAVDLATIPEAKWGEPRALTPATPTAADASAMPDAGAPLDPSAYRFRRTLPAGPTGLVALPLDASVLAHSRGAGRTFEDVRVVDESGRQIPYLVERLEEPVSLDLELEPFAGTTADARPADGHNRSAYVTALPYTTLPNATLVLETSARVFARTVSVGVERPADRTHRDPWFDTIRSMTWTVNDQDAVAPALSIPLGTTSTGQLVIVVDEGDNSALPLTKARLLLPSYRIRFYHPGRPLTLVYGRDDVSLPRYDLALLATQVMGAEAKEIAAAPQVEGKSGPVASLISPKMFWAGLVVAVLIIGGVIVRSMRAE